MSNIELGDSYLVLFTSSSANHIAIRYQFHYVPSNDQFNQLLHIAIGMTDDMGLNLRPADAMKKKATLRLAHYRKAGVLTADHDEFFSREARRAYLGCFYISSV